MLCVKLYRIIIYKNKTCSLDQVLLFSKAYSTRSRYKISIAMAVASPPPIQSAAIPRVFPKRLSA